MIAFFIDQFFFISIKGNHIDKFGFSEILKAFYEIVLFLFCFLFDQNKLSGFSKFINLFKDIYLECFLNLLSKLTDIIFFIFIL